MPHFTMAVILVAGLILAPKVSAYEVAPVRDGGVVRGRVVFQGQAPAAKKLSITKDTDVCGTGPSERHEVRLTRGVLRDVVVTIQDVTQGKAWPAGEVTLDQKHCVFLPYVQVVHPGGQLAVINSDPVLHNLHPFEVSGSTRRTLFNLAQPTQGSKIVKTVAPRNSEVVRLECDAHTWMLAWLYVPKNPYYAVVGEDGSFTIDQVPPGTYKMRAWHPVLGVQERQVTVGPKRQTDVAFEFSSR
jgi:Polysaccharide lyase family 4, domain II